MNKIFVLDSTIFLEGYADAFMDKACITVFEVTEEVKNKKAAIDLDKLLMTCLQIVSPSTNSVEKVKEIQKKTNDKLSVTDLRLLALSLDFKNKGKNVEVVSDDYAIQNICKILNIHFLPISQKGIKKAFEWIRKCPTCKQITEKKICDKCGIETVFVPKEI